jgi:hypothetical protein
MFLLPDKDNYIGRDFMVSIRYYYMFRLNKNVITVCYVFTIR